MDLKSNRARKIIKDSNVQFGKFLLISRLNAISNEYNKLINEDLDDEYQKSISILKNNLKHSFLNMR
ncbi:MAG: hypothetical protein PHV68_04425 [Candidatus Gastranaerophilales bacterium]|nr:hypothetical protein [Candidatus Gastranaerophilales bacterium]